MTATHLPTFAPPDARPATGDCAWALAELDDLIGRADASGVAGMILRQAQRELRSVLVEAAAPAARVVGPLRIRRAA